MKYYKTKIIELFGLPKTGKTTTVNALKKYMQSKGLSTEIVRERASLCPIKDKLHPSFNYWTAISFIKEYVEANEKGIDYLIADRGIIDALIWVKLLSNKSKSNELEDEFNSMVYQKFILENYLISFYYKAEFDVILNREEERQIKKSFGRIMNKEIFEEYTQTYNSLKNTLLKISDIIEIDSTENNIPKLLDEVSKHINKIN